MYKECMLTTVDNPFDPFKQFNDWFLFDVEKGYYTCSKLGRIVNITDEQTQKETNEEVERAIDDFIKYDILDIYKKVSRTYTEEELLIPTEEHTL